MSIIMLEGHWAIPIDCLVISGDLQARMKQRITMGQNYRSERLLERETDRWRQSSEITIVCF